MTTDNNLFNSSNQDVVNDNNTNVNPFSDQLNKITNSEGAPKYDSVEKALEALGHSQAFIPGLESQISSKDIEIAQLKEKLSGVESVQSLIDKHTATLNVVPETLAPVVQEQQDVASLVTQALQKQQAATTEQANLNSVQAELTKAFGDKATEVIQQKAAALQTTPAYLETLARTNPTMLMTLLGTAQAVAQPATTYGSVSIPSLNPIAVAKLGRPAESLLAGAKPNAQRDFMRQIRDEVYRDLGVET
jgi:hypothetical protein